MKPKKFPPQTLTLIGIDGLSGRKAALAAFYKQEKTINPYLRRQAITLVTTSSAKTVRL